jgi:uncharacterized GH25 family protein
MRLPHVAAIALLAPPSVLVAAAPAAGHEYWLSPSSYRTAAGDTLAIRALVGTGFRGEPRPYAPSRVRRFTLTASRTIDLASHGRNGDLEWARFALPDAGGALFAYESDFAPITLPAAEFDDYLALEGLSGPLAARARLGANAGPGRERYARCPKTWIAGTTPSRASRPAGLSLEIVPLGDPGASGPLRVRVLHRGRPLAGALLRAWNQPLRGFAPRDAAERDSVGPAIETRTGKDGIATLALPRAGEWMVACVHMEPCRERAVADWESRWASFTFARTAPAR